MSERETSLALGAEQLKKERGKSNFVVKSIWRSCCQAEPGGPLGFSFGKSVLSVTLAVLP